MSKAEKIGNPLHQYQHFMRIRDVVAFTGISRSQLYCLSAEGKFPRSVLLVPGGTSKGWVKEEVIQWCFDRVAERDEVAVNE